VGARPTQPGSPQTRPAASPLVMGCVSVCVCLNGRALLQAKQFTAKYAVNICSAQENDFNCIIKLDVDSASGQKRWGEARSRSCLSEFVDRRCRLLFADLAAGLPSQGTRTKGGGRREGGREEGQRRYAILTVRDEQTLRTGRTWLCLPSVSRTFRLPQTMVT
jgi:hypothetical protein